MSIWRVPRLTTAERLTITPQTAELLFDVTSGTYWGGNGLTLGGVPIGAGGAIESPVLAFNAVSPVTITTLQNGDKVIKATVIISQAFDGTGAAVTIGTDATPDLLVGSNDIDVADVGTYEVFPQYFATGATEIKVFLTPGTLATTGEVFISLEVGG